MTIEEYPLATRLLIACLNSQNQYQAKLLADSSSDVDWEQASVLSRKQMVAPIFFQRLKAMSADVKIPNYVLESLREDYLANIFKNTRIYQELGSILKQFNDLQIPVIILKGAFLAEKVYSSIALRSIGDLDILVPQDNLESAYLAFLDNGYHANYRFDLEEESTSKHSLPALVATGKPQIDLHWTLFPPDLPFRLDIEDVWRTAKVDSLTGAEIHSLTCEFQLLHLCVHFAYLHRFASQLFHVCDIYETIRLYQTQIDWEKLLDMAGKYQMVKPIFLALKIAQFLLEAPVPEEIMDRFQPEDYQPQYLDWFTSHLLSGTDFSINLAEIWAPRSSAERVNFFFKNVFWKPGLMREKYPRLAGGIGLPLAYLFRLADVIRRQLPGFWQLLIRDSRTQAAAQHIQNVERVEKWFKTV